jgi:hypothetical protein
MLKLDLFNKRASGGPWNSLLNIQVGFLNEVAVLGLELILRLFDIEQLITRQAKTQSFSLK